MKDYPLDSIATAAAVKDGEPCNHKGCLNHVTHPCDGCGRRGAGLIKQAQDSTNKKEKAKQVLEDAGFIGREIESLINDLSEKRIAELEMVEAKLDKMLLIAWKVIKKAGLESSSTELKKFMGD